MPPKPGQSGVIVPVPGADPLLHHVSDRYCGVVQEGVVAHVTVLYPFLDAAELTDEVVECLAALMADHVPTEIEFSRWERFPRLLYLAPEPADWFRALTTTVNSKWPEILPYEGAYEDSPPHLTVAHHVDDETMTRIEQEVGAYLPLRTRLDEAWLVTFDGHEWTPHARFPFTT